VIEQELLRTGRRVRRAGKMGARSIPYLTLIRPVYARGGSWSLMAELHLPGGVANQLVLCVAQARMRVSLDIIAALFEQRSCSE
jgi:hypothetical protein